MNKSLFAIIILLIGIGLVILKKLNRKPTPIPPSYRTIRIDSLFLEYIKDSVTFINKLMNAVDTSRSVDIVGVLNRTFMDTSGLYLFLQMNNIELSRCKMDPDYHSIDKDPKVGDTVIIQGLMLKKNELFQMERCSIKEIVKDSTKLIN